MEENLTCTVSCKNIVRWPVLGKGIYQRKCDSVNSLCTPFKCLFSENVRNFEILKIVFKYHGKCIKVSTNKPMFGPVVLEIAVVFSYIKKNPDGNMYIA